MLATIIIGMPRAKSSVYQRCEMKNVTPLIITGISSIASGNGILSGRRGSCGRLNSLGCAAGCSRGGRL